MATADIDLGRYKLGWSDVEDYVYKPKKGLSSEIIEEMSWMKGEPDWMRNFRLRSLSRFERKPMAEWFASRMPDIDFDDIYYYIKPTEGQVDAWDELPESVKSTYEKLGIPEAERRYLAGVTAQYECLRGSTRVWTDKGMRRVKELARGERVFSLDEESRAVVPSTVVAGGCSGEKEVFEIRAQGRTIGASANHPFLVLRDEPSPGPQRARHAARWVPVEELQVGDRVAVATEVPEFGQSVQLLAPAGPRGRFPEKTSDEFCWWAGIYLGGGRLHRRGALTTLEIAVDPADTELASEIRRVTRVLFAVELRPASDGLRLRGEGTAALGEFVELNGLGGTSATRRLPEWCYGLPRSERLALLSGLLDSDGHVRTHPTPKDAVARSANASLLEDVDELLALSGTSSGSVTRASDMLGFARVDSIEAVGVEPVFDIEVSGHHNFVAEGFVVHNSEVVYHRNRTDLESQGVLFCDMDTALREYPEIVKRWFGTVIPPNDNKFAALNSAVWSGGSFIYVPPGIKVEMPLQAYFRINAENMGQFERTLIIADEGSQVHYIEGCSAPVYASDSLHSAVVELVALPGSRITYTTIQNWSSNVYNLVTKRARAEAEARVEWIDGNIGCLAQGSRVTTPGGLKPIELVVPGDRVLSYDEGSGQLTFRTVRAARFSGYQQVREVRSGARRLQVTDNHPFYSYQHDESRPEELGRHEPGYVRADRLRQAVLPVSSIDYGHPHKLAQPEVTTILTGADQHDSGLRSARPRSARLELPEESTDELMWLFGLFGGGGSVDRAPAENGEGRRAHVTFSVPAGARARLRLLEVLSRLLPGAAPGEPRDGLTLRWSSLELADALELNGFVSGDSAKRVPEWVLDLPESQRLSFVAGYLDSAGYAPRTGGGLGLEPANRSLLEGVAAVLTSLGIPCHLSSEPEDERDAGILGERSTGRDSHRLDLAADRRLLDRVSPGLGEAARPRPVAGLRPLRRVGRSETVLPETVEAHRVEVGEAGPAVPTWDIEVEGTGNFVSEGFIVHNSRLTMKYPSVYLMGPKASGEVLSVAYAGPGQHQDAGAKMFHVAPETTSTIVSKSVSKDGGITTYRGKVHVDEGARHSKSFVRCDALLLDEDSVSETKPYMEVGERDAQIGHEATVSKVGEDQLFYLMSRGLSEQEAMGMIVNGFIEPVTRTLPMEYAVEWSRLIELQMEGAVG
jgi:Fe-S cluster assembly scaffold protein SufB